MKKVSIGEIISRAIQREEQAISFYTRLKDVVGDPVSRDTLDLMAGEELKHREILERYARGELGGDALSLREVTDGRVVEMLGPPAVNERMDHKDIFLVAAEREKASHQFYLRLASLQPGGTAKQLFRKLAQEELVHKEKAEYLYCNAAFPQTDGG